MNDLEARFAALKKEFDALMKQRYPYIGRKIIVVLEERLLGTLVKQDTPLWTNGYRKMSTANNHYQRGSFSPENKKRFEEILMLLGCPVDAERALRAFSDFITEVFCDVKTRFDVDVTFGHMSKDEIFQIVNDEYTVDDEEDETGFQKTVHATLLHCVDVLETNKKPDMFLLETRREFKQRLKI